MTRRSTIERQATQARRHVLAFALTALAVAALAAGCVTPFDPRGDDVGEWGRTSTPHGVLVVNAR